MRPFVSKTKGEMRQIAIALEEYKIQHGIYPLPKEFDTRNIPSIHKYAKTIDLDIIGIIPDKVHPAYHPWDNNYKGPYDYRDWFTISWFNRMTLPYLYYSDGNGFILIATGPDGDYDIDPVANYDSRIIQPSVHLVYETATYDPTNGAISNGDIYRTKM